MKKKDSLALAVFLLLGNIAMSSAQENTGDQDRFFISAQLRSRGEYRNGALIPRNEGESPAGFINERARLTLGYERKKLSLRFSAQHVGVWGQDALVDKNGRFILNEAWAGLELSDSWLVQLGRQALVYDDERILGGLDWNVAGRYHDALKIVFHKTGISFMEYLLSIKMMSMYREVRFTIAARPSCIKICRPCGTTMILILLR